MLKVEAVATVTYTCELSDENEKMVIKYIKDNPDEFKYMTDKESILAAVDILYNDSKLDLYDDSVESDFSTEEINWSEFEDRSPEEVFNEVKEGKEK